MKFDELQKKIELGKDNVQQVYIEALEDYVPIRELTKKELVELSAKATEHINVEFDKDGNPTMSLTMSELTKNEAKVDAKAVIYGLEVEGKGKLTVDYVLDNWKSSAVEEIAQAIYNITGENPKESVKKNKKNKTISEVEGDSFRTQ